MLATRAQLQDNEIEARMPIFTQCTSKFNDWSINSGGLIVQREEFTAEGIDPETRNLSGPLPAVHAYKIFKDIRKDYAEASRRYELSGRHNEHDFFNYCNGDLNVLYLLLVLMANAENLSLLCN